MGEVGDEVAADPFQRSQPGHVHEHQDRARRAGVRVRTRDDRVAGNDRLAGAHRRRPGEDIPSGDRNLAFARLSPHRRLDHLEESFPLEHPAGVPPAVLLPGVSRKRQKLAKRPVQVLDPEIAVEDGHALDHAREDRRPLVLFRSQGFEGGLEGERGAVQRGEQGAQLVLPGHRGLGSEVALGDAFREAHELFDPISEPPRVPPGERGRREGRQQRHHDHRREDGPERVLDPDHRFGQAEHGVGIPGQAHRDVAEVLAARLREALRAAIARREGVPDLRAAGVVVHRRRVFVGVGENRAFARHQRHPSLGGRRSPAFGLRLERGEPERPAGKGFLAGTRGPGGEPDLRNGIEVLEGRLHRVLAHDAGGRQQDRQQGGRRDQKADRRDPEGEPGRPSRASPAPGAARPGQAGGSKR